MLPEEAPLAGTVTEPLPDAAAQAPDPEISANEKHAAGQGAVTGDGTKTDREDILVEGEVGPPPGDPLENVNVQTFEVVQAVDKALVEPVAHGYIKLVPKPMRDGIHNVVTNLDEPIVFLSFLLQLKPLKALATVGRFAINSTLGLGGLIDVAKRKPFNAPHVRNGFGHTLAYYGVKPGPFLYLPLIGSTTVRDFIGQMAQIPVLPFVIGKPFNRPAYVIPKVTISAIDDRTQDDERIQQIRAQSSNPYVNYRSYYLRKRQAELDVIKGLRDNAEVQVFDDELPGTEDVAPVDVAPEDKGAALDSGAVPPAAGVQLPVDDAVALAH